MADPRATEQEPPSGGAFEPALEVSAEEYRESVGEALSDTLDLGTWRSGPDLAQEYRRVEDEIAAAVRREDGLLEQLRATVFPRLRTRAGAPPGAGVYQARLPALERVHRGLLFNGGVEACDGTLLAHDTLPLTIYQIGVSLASYQGHQGAWGHRLFRRDLRVSSGDPTADVVRLLEQRVARDALNWPSRRDRLSELMRRGIMAHAERAILWEQSQAVWRLGHGSPAPYELITGSGNPDLMIESTRIVRALIEQHRKFVFVASEPRDRVLLSIGQALRPLEYAIVDSLRDRIERTVLHGHYRGHTTVDRTWDGEELSVGQWIRRFLDRVAPQVVVGVYRASAVATAQVFYAHVDHAHDAAHIVLADSVLQEHRGFPLLIDLAHNVCSSVFGADTLAAPVATGYANVSAPWRFVSERASRRT